MFRLDKASNETVLNSFTGGSDGGAPFGGVIRDDAGNLYGTTQSGGAYGSGTVFKLDPTGKFTSLHSFTGKEGAGPMASVVRDIAGILYGTTPSGGAYGFGVVYRVTP